MQRYNLSKTNIFNKPKTYFHKQLHERYLTNEYRVGEATWQERFIDFNIQVTYNLLKVCLNISQLVWDLRIIQTGSCINFFLLQNRHHVCMCYMCYWMYYECHNNNCFYQLKENVGVQCNKVTIHNELLWLKLCIGIPLNSQFYILFVWCFACFWILECLPFLSTFKTVPYFTRQMSNERKNQLYCTG